MGLAAIKRIIAEDFPEQRSWIGKLLEPLNGALSTVSKLLDRGLTFQENFKAQVKDLNFLNDSTAFPLYFRCDIGARPTGLWVVNVVEDTASPTAFSDAVFLTWEYQQDGRIKVLGATGLTSGRRYKLTVVVV